MTRDQIEGIRKAYRKAYDRLYVASMKADSAAESDRINNSLAFWNERLAAAEAAFEAAS